MRYNPIDILATAIYLQRVVPESSAKKLLTSTVLPTDSRAFLEWWGEHLPYVPKPDDSAWERATEHVTRHDLNGVTSVGLPSAQYPPSLRLLPDPPTVLFVRGDHSCLERLRGVAVVGSRDTSNAGIKIASRISQFLSESGWGVVSGLALGIDAAAHEGALLGPTPTVAVLAHGLEYASPKRNALLADRIIERGGCWVSEHAIGVSARKDFFVLRNRIQIGLSAGSIIVEAALHSGSMAQANYCIRDKRELFAVIPHQISNPLGLKCEGTIDMVKRLNAMPIKTRDDYPDVLDRLQNCYKALQLG